LVRIAEIETGSIADELRLEIGSRVVRINGERVRDNIDLTFLLADTDLEIETVSPAGETVVYEVERAPGQPIGILPQPDAVRECANECVFCFIDGNPPGVRDALWLRDDDFRLSFTYGSYVTLTNLGPRGLQRLVDQGLSPLYVSVHASDPEVRHRMLVNDRAGLILEQLEFLLAGGLSLHTQVVLCPEWNDGPHLEQTIADLWALGPGIRSLSVVPVGLTRYNVNRPVRPLTHLEAGEAIDRVDRARAAALGERGYGWAYSADEMYLIAGRKLPGAAYYDDGALHENGVGAVRRFLEDLDGGMSDLPDLRGSRVRLVTGRSMAPFIAGRAGDLAAATGARVEVVDVTNSFFGELVTVAGLLAGRDMLTALGPSSTANDIVVLPAEALNAQDDFIDSLPYAEFEHALAPARVVRGHEITEALRSL